MQVVIKSEQSHTPFLHASINFQTSSFFYFVLLCIFFLTCVRMRAYILGMQRYDFLRKNASFTIAALVILTYFNLFLPQICLLPFNSWIISLSGARLRFFLILFWLFLSQFCVAKLEKKCLRRNSADKIGRVFRQD